VFIIKSILSRKLAKVKGLHLSKCCFFDYINIILALPVSAKISEVHIAVQFEAFQKDDQKHHRDDRGHGVAYEHRIAESHIADVGVDHDEQTRKPEYKQSDDVQEECYIGPFESDEHPGDDGDRRGSDHREPF